MSKMQGIIAVMDATTVSIAVTGAPGGAGVATSNTQPSSSVMLTNTSNGGAIEYKAGAGAWVKLLPSDGIELAIDLASTALLFRRARYDGGLVSAQLVISGKPVLKLSENGLPISISGSSATAPGQPAKPVLTAMAGAVSLAWTPGAAGSTATTSNIWTDINGNVTQLTTNPQTITAPAGTPYTGTVTTLNGQGAGPASVQADAVTPLAADPVPTSFSWIIKNTIFGSSAYAAQVGFHNPGRTSILFHNDTPYWGQYVLSGASNNDYNQPTGSWVDIPPNAQVLVTDPGKPYVRGKAFAITSITSDGATATVTTAAPHNLATGASVRVQDVTPAGYNGAFTSVTVTGANTFTYPLAATLAATTAPGTWAGRPLTGFTVQTKAAK